MNHKGRWKGSRFKGNEGGSTDRKVFNIKVVECDYCNPDYDLEILEGNEIDDEGLLLIGKLKPKVDELPEFWLRWDARKDALDVDIYEGSKKKDWGKGYRGHHTERIEKESGRNYKVLIEMPKMKVYEGMLGFNLERDVELVERLSLSEEIIVVKKNAPKKKP